jgi:transposase InsO family protein
MHASRLGLRLILSSFRRQLLELQFQLIDEPLAAFRARAEHLALHLGDHSCRCSISASASRSLARVSIRRRFQNSSVIGKRIDALDHARDSSTIKLGNGRYCYPLTVTDQAPRFLLLCEALESTREDLAFTAFERLFVERGLPLAIRSDGVPFASPNALFNLSKLSVWWLRLGIAIERIKPGRPQQNGRHERMHLTLKKEATRPPGQNSLQQQARFDAFTHEFNTERLHEALAMQCPPSSTSPHHDATTVCRN